MADFDWNKYPKVESNNNAGFDWDKFPKVQEKTSIPMSAARGAVQGATLGYIDEISGGFKGIADDMVSLFSNNPNAPKAKRDEFGRITNLDELNQSANYSKYRDEYRKADKKAKEDNPGAFTAGEIGGSVLSSVIPIGPTKTVADAAITAAKLGAITGLGMSEADNFKDLATDVGISSGIGLAGGVAAKGLEKAAGAIMGAAKKTGREAAETLSKEAGSIPIESPDVLKEVTKSARNRVKNYWNPEIDPSWDEFAEIARKNGIDPEILPESIKFGPDSAVSRATRNIAEGRYGEETLKRFNRSLEEVRNAFDSKITKYAQGAPVDEVTAGNILRDSYDEGVSKFFDQMDFTHNTIVNQVPNFRLTEDALKKIDSSLNGLEKFAKGRALRGVTQTQRGQAQQLLNAVEAIRNGNGSYKQTVEALRDIGEAAFQSKNSLADIPVDVQKMRKLYNDINESLIDTVRYQLGDDIADNLVQNNKAMSEFFGDQSLVARILGDKAIAPEKAFQSLVLNGDTKKIEALKKIISPEKWEYLKGATLENIVKRDPEGGFKFSQLYSNMRNKKNTLAAIFTPEELAESAGLVRLGDRFGSPVLSNSGTGASLSFQDITKNISNLTTDALAIRNATKAANKATTIDATKLPPKEIPEVLKEVFPKAAGAVAGSNYSTSGQDKWINKGSQTLLNLGLPEAEIEALKKTKEGKNLLIDAADARPGTKRMESVIKRLQKVVK